MTFWFVVSASVVGVVLMYGGVQYESDIAFGIGMWTVILSAASIVAVPLSAFVVGWWLP